MMSSFSFCDSVLTDIRDRRSPKFSGIGIVFYRNLSALPRLDLGDISSTRPALPVFGAAKIGDVLARIGDADSPWHDGFHLIDVVREALTHISQFLSPDVGPQILIDETQRPFGARQMASLLASRLNGIERVGLLTPTGGISYFESGMLRQQGTKK